MRKVIIIVFILTVMSSCSKAPDEVKREEEILNNNNQAQSAELDYICLDEIRKTSLESLKSNNTNVTVDNVIIGEGNVMPAYKISPYNPNFDDLKDLVYHLYQEEFSLDSPFCEYNIGGRRYDENDPESDINPHSFIMYMGKNMDMSRSLIYHETGYSFYNRVAGGDPYRFTELFPIEKRYRVNLGQSLDDVSYNMLDGSDWGIKDAAEFAQDFVDEYLAPLENNLFTYSMTDFTVKKLDDSFGYVIEYQRIDKNGNLYDNHYYYANDEIYYDNSSDNWIAEGIPYLYSSQIQLAFNEKEQINSFIKCNTPYTGEIIDNGEQLISLTSAINIISSSMADKSAYSFETAELEYYYIGNDCPDYTSPAEGEEPNVDTENMLNNVDIQLRPFWAFTMSGCYPDITGYDSTTVNQNCLYLVDALTGELYIY